MTYDVVKMEDNTYQTSAVASQLLVMPRGPWPRRFFASKPDAQPPRYNPAATYVYPASFNCQGVRTINRKSARMIAAALGTLAVAAALVAYISETSMTLRADLLLLIIAIVVGVGTVTLRR